MGSPLPTRVIGIELHPLISPVKDTRRRAAYFTKVSPPVGHNNLCNGSPIGKI